MTRALGNMSDPTLIDLLRDVWRARMAMVVGAGLAALCALVFISVSVPHHRASMMIAPAERAGRADIKALLPDNPSFALQYLVNTLGSPDHGDFMRFEQSLRGAVVSGRLMTDEDLRRGVMRGGRFVFSPSPRLDSAAHLSEWMMRHVRIETVGHAPIRRISVDHPDPAFAVALLERLYTETDRMIRADLGERTRARADHLRRTLDDVRHPDHRRALLSLLMEQEHILMIAAMDEPFAAVMIEPPVVAPRTVWPRRGLTFALFIVAGMFVGYVVSGLRARR